jgi:hypothetical protein
MFVDIWRFRTISATKLSSKYTDTQQIELGTTIHLALYQFQSVDMTFSWSAAPIIGKSRFDHASIN